MLRMCLESSSADRGLLEDESLEIAQEYFVKSGSDGVSEQGDTSFLSLGIALATNEVPRMLWPCESNFQRVKLANLGDVLALFLNKADVKQEVASAAAVGRGEAFVTRFILRFS
jgi:hypothetical protein